MIIIADDIMVVGKQQNHRDHDTALTNLPETARKCNICLNFDKLHYKKKEVDFFGEPTPLMVARLSELTEVIRELSKDKVPFNWGPEHQAAFKLIKKEIVRAPILAYYNPKKEAILQTDTNIKGLGACLLQDQKPVYFMSKVLTETQ